MDQYSTEYSLHQKRQLNANNVLDGIPHSLCNVIDPTPHFFNQTNRLKLYDERAYYRDDDHLTRYGAEQFLHGVFDGIFDRIVKSGTAPIDNRSQNEQESTNLK